MTESISRAVRRYGTRGCAGRRAQESGDHPRSSPGGCGGPACSPPGRPPAGLPAGPQPPGRPSTGRPRGHGPTRRRAEMNEACGRRRSAVRAAYRVHRRGELDLDRHCTSWLRAALSAQGWTIWPVVRGSPGTQSPSCELPRRQPFDRRRSIIRWSSKRATYGNACAGS